jgi:hypothetical protein
MLGLQLMVQSGGAGIFKGVGLKGRKLGQWRHDLEGNIHIAAPFLSLLLPGCHKVISFFYYMLPPWCTVLS